MRTRSRLLVIGALVAVVSACGTQSPFTSSTTPPSGTLSPGGFPATGTTTVEVGQTVAFSMYTHCGVESTRINGRVWNAAEPLYASRAKLGPPVGWGNPEQAGQLTLETEDRAVFAAVGQRVVLLPSPTNEALRPCD